MGAVAWKFLRNWKTQSFQENYVNSENCIAVSHALTGCDTTLEFYNKGKKTSFDLIEKMPM